jgi:hypothetical protein
LAKKNRYSKSTVNRSLALEGRLLGFCQMMTLRQSQPRSTISRAKRNGIKQSDLRGAPLATGRVGNVACAWRKRRCLLPVAMRLSPLERVAYVSPKLTQQVPVAFRTRFTSSKTRQRLSMY